MQESNPFTGLSDEEVIKNRELFGMNTTVSEHRSRFLEVVKEIIIEPLFLLLVMVAIIYFVLGEYDEGIIMLIAICFVSGISIFQENRSRNAIDTLKKLSSPLAKVNRNGKTIEIPMEEIVVSDIMLLEDGFIIPADGVILRQNDFTVNESILTGESLPVTKTLEAPGNNLFQGTLVLSGSCIAKVVKIGAETSLGKIGQALTEIEVPRTPLQEQIRQFIRHMVIVGIIAFLVVWGINYYISQNVLHGLLHGLTIAMSVLPEEIPVAFSTFMALGAFHLYKKKVIAKSPYAVETLGAASVICCDKTGTITENKMGLAAIYQFKEDKTFDYTKEPLQLNEVLEFALWASETAPFDNMEKSIHAAYSAVCITDKRTQFTMIHEYPLEGTPPMMTHVFSDGKADHIIACKGAVESVVRQCRLTPEELLKIQAKTQLLATKGYRVLAVARSQQDISRLPQTQQELEFIFIGLIAFYDPPKTNMVDILKQFNMAGIRIKMITGDYAETAISIAEQVEFKNSSKVLSGEEVMKMDEETLRTKVNDVNIFARMFPEAKLKIIEALKSNGEVVAMIGDGVNDGPALKASHIGIAMGLRGSELAKKVSALILMDDDLFHLIGAVSLGRRIYENLKKAIQYIISIHIPIILIVMLPLLLFWQFTDFFSPVHIIFLELIMGPTCSIIFENEPIEANSMSKPPRKISNKFFSLKELSLSIVQGLVITLACLGTGFYFMQHNYSIEITRTIIFSTLIFSNLLLTLVNRSFYYSIWTTMKYKNHLVPIILLVSLLILFASIYFSPLRTVFAFSPLTIQQILFCTGTAFVGVVWIELFKAFRRQKEHKKSIALSVS